MDFVRARTLSCNPLSHQRVDVNIALLVEPGEKHIGSRFVRIGHLNIGLLSDPRGKA